MTKNFFQIFLLKKKKLVYISSLLSKILLPKSIIFLIGNIGLGKTIFVKNFIGYITNYRTIAKSPTYSIIDYYFCKTIVIYHLDFYRVSQNKKFIELDIIEFLQNNYFIMIEWGNIIFNESCFSNINIYLFYYYNFLNRFFIVKSFFNNHRIFYG